MKSHENYFDYYYWLGDYIYNTLHPEVTGNLDMFKYILDKVYLDAIMGTSDLNIAV